MNKVKEKPPGYVTGRPTKYRKEFCKQLIEHMAEGFSFESFAGTVDTHRAVVHEWVKRHEEFSEAKKEGDAKARIWWEKLHRRCAATGEGNATMIVWAQKNKWPKQYCERVAKGANQIEHNIKQNLAVTGDFKSIVATLTPDQMYQLSLALEQKAKEIEEKHDTK